MALEHLVVHKSSDYLCAFPDIIRLHNGDLVTVFRESAIHPPDRNPERPQDAKITHHHVITGSRVALVRSTDDGCTWDPASRIVVDPGNDSQDLNMPLISQLTSGELIVVNHRWFVNLTEAQLAALRGTRSIRFRPPARSVTTFSTASTASGPATKALPGASRNLCKRRYPMGLALARRRSWKCRTGPC